jgi:hypothetical protein
MISDGRWGILSTAEVAVLTADEIVEYVRYRLWLHDHPTQHDPNGWWHYGVDDDTILYRSPAPAAGKETTRGDLP